MDINENGQIVAGSSRGLFKTDAESKQVEFLEMNGRRLYASDGVDDEDDEDPEWIGNVGVQLTDQGTFLAGSSKGWVLGNVNNDDLSLLEQNGKRLYADDGARLLEDGRFLLGTTRGLMTGDLTP